MRTVTLLPIVAALAVGLACGETTPTPPPEPPPAPPVETPPPAAEAPPAATGPVTVGLKDATGKDVGTATLTPSAAGAGVSLALSLHDLPPGSHALHFHEKPLCEGPKFESAGGHFNPEHKHHGLENPEGPHAGDMPNVEVGADGTATVTIDDPRVSLAASGADSLVAAGSALVIHAKADDLKSDPAGNAGERIACGVVAASTTAPAAAPNPGAGTAPNEPAGVAPTPPPAPPEH